MRLSAYTVDRLTERHIDVRLNTMLDSAVDGHIKLSDGEEFDAETLVWTAGVKANPILADTDLPLDDKGRLPCKANLTVKGVTGVFSAGDCAAVPDLSQERPERAVRAERAARGAAGEGAGRRTWRPIIHGGSLRDYKHAYAGSVASLGLYRGVAEIYGIKLRGFPAWFMHRTYHVSRMPTLNRKIRIVADWTAALLFRREVVSLGQLQSPHTEFEQAAGRREFPEVS